MVKKFFSGVIYAIPISQRKGSKCFDQRKKSVTFRITLRVYSKKYVRQVFDRPVVSFFNDRYGCVNLIWSAEFLRYYYLAAKPQDNDWQPVELFVDLLENNFSNKIYPPIIPLNVKKFLLFLRLFIPNKDKDYELYAQYLLKLYYPFRKESDLKTGSPPSYSDKLPEVDVLQVIN